RKSSTTTTLTSSSLIVRRSTWADRGVELIGGGLGLHQAPPLELGELGDRPARLVGLDDRVERQDAGDAAGDPLVVVANVFAGSLDALDRDPLGPLEARFVAEPERVLEVDARDHAGAEALAEFLV